MVSKQSLRSTLLNLSLALMFGVAPALAADPRDPAPPMAITAAPFLALFGEESPLDAAEAERLRARVDAFVTRLHGPRRGRQWDMVYETEPFRVEPLQAWLWPQATPPEVWLALGAGLPEGSRRLHGSRLRLFVLRFDAQGQLVTHSRSPWMEEGFYGLPPILKNPMRVGRERWAFVSITPQSQGGAHVTTYKLRAPKGPAFQRLGDFWHQTKDGTFELWTERLELQSRPDDDTASCWPLVGIRTRFAGRARAGEGQQLWQRERRIPCNQFGTYGTLHVN